MGEKQSDREGDTLEYRLIQLANSREEIPHELQEYPDIPPQDYFLLRAFLSLDTCRQAAMERGRIPWTAIWDYGNNCLSMGPQEFQDFEDIIQLLDVKWLEYLKETSDNG